MSTFTVIACSVIRIEPPYPWIVGDFDTRKQALSAVYDDISAELDPWLDSRECETVSDFVDQFCDVYDESGDTRIVFNDDDGAIYVWRIIAK